MTTGPVTVRAMPATIEEFTALRDEIAGTPQGGAVVMAIAMMTYADDEALGRQFLTVAADRGRLQQGPQGYKGWQLNTPETQRLKSRILGKSHIMRSYVQGTNADTGYALPAAPLTFNASENPYSGDAASGTFKVFLASTGADSPRPVTLKRNDKGLWKAHEWSSLTLGVVPPKEEIDDDL